MRRAGVLDTMSRWVVRHPVWVTAGLCALIAGATVASTFVAVWWVNRRPFGVAIAPDRSEAYLVSFAGRRVLTLPGGGETDAITAAHKVDVGGGKWLALIAYGPRSSVDAGRVVAFDPRHPGTPMWRTGGPGYPEYSAPNPALHSARDAYRASHGWCVCDMFPDPGPEIITSFSHSNFSPESIRVLNALTGDVLFEAWHDGAVNDITWLEDPRLIVCIGLGNRVEPKDVAFVDWPPVEPKSRGTPQVVFAIQPERGVRQRQWLGSPDSSSACKAAWYKVFGPAHVHRDAVLTKFIGFGGTYDASRHCRLSVEGRSIVGAVIFTLDSEGTVVARYASGAFDDPDNPILKDVRLTEVHNFDPNTRARTYWGD